MRLPWASSSTVRARFSAAEPSVRRSFVAALWAARGWETRIEGERVIARGHPTWGDETLLVPDRRPPARLEGSDAVVAAGTAAAGGRTVTPADLQRMALYAGDREAAAAACRRYLDVELDPSPTEAAERSGAPLAEVGLVAIVAVVVLAAVFGVVGGGGQSAPTAAAERTTPTASERAETVAPGVTREGLIDVGALASAHAGEVDQNRPYVWDLRYEEYNASGDSSPTVTHTETVWVVDENRYRVDKDRLYTQQVPKVGPLVVDNRAYADGTHRYVRYRLGGHAEFERIPIAEDGPGASRYSARSADLIERFLDAEDVRVRSAKIDGEPYIQLYGFGTERFDVDRYRVVAFLTDEGFVRELSVTFRDPDTDTAVILAYEYTEFEGTLEPPPWVGDAEIMTVAEDPPGTTSNASDDGIEMPDATLPNGTATPSDDGTATPSNDETSTPASDAAATTDGTS